MRRFETLVRSPGPPGLLIAALLALVGCAGRIEAAVKEKAAPDLACDASTIAVEQGQTLQSQREYYRAHGCDKTQLYTVSCNLFGCNTKLAPVVGMRKPLDDPADEEYRESTRPKTPPAKPWSSVGLKNTCKDTIVIFAGEDPAGAKGKHHTMRKGELFRTSGRQGEKIWLVDPARVTAGIDSFELDPSISEMFIDDTCTKFSRTEPAK